MEQPEAGPVRVDNGIYDGFEAYRTPTDQDYERLLAAGMIVLDTNVLIDLYRYNEESRNNLLQVLEGLAARLWVPHQVIKEFWENRHEVLQDPREVDKTVGSLTKSRSTAENILRNWAKRVRLPKGEADRLSSVLQKAFDSVIEEAKSLGKNDGREFAGDTSKDPLVSKLDDILQGRVGQALSEEETLKAIAEGKRRGKEQIPPGYMDVGTDGKGPTGDYQIWDQIIRQARGRQEDVLFVTADDKEDWWRKSDSRVSLGPRPELVEEISREAKIKLFMLPPDGLLQRGGDVLSLHVSKESVEDVKRVSSRFASGWQVREGDNHSLIRVVATDLVELIDSAIDLGPKAESLILILAEASEGGRPKALIAAVWPVLEDPSILKWAQQNRQVRNALRVLRDSAVQAWLEDRASSYMSSYTADHNALFDCGPLPPSIVIANAAPIIIDDQGVGQFEFAAAAIDGREYRTTRVVPVPIDLEK